MATDVNNTQASARQEPLEQELNTGIGFEAPDLPAEPALKRVHVIINPAAGQSSPVLATLNSVFHPLGVDWDVFITKQAGDGTRLAQEAVAAGVDAVGVYGGDGTVMEVARGLIGSDVPLAIFPGGTANVVSVELGIPSNLAEAVALVCGDACATRSLDMGEINGEYFLLRVGLGLEAQMVEGADRDLKDRMGVFAYALSALQALREPQPAHYTITIDGEEMESDGVACIIANAGSMGVGALTLAPTIDVSDGLLDVVVMRQADLFSLLTVVKNVVTGAPPGADANQPMQHWQGREITVVPSPPQSVQVDGEVIETAHITARVVPQAVKVIVPRPPA